MKTSYWNIEKKFIDDFTKQGYDDYRDGVDCSECPFDEGTDGEGGWWLGRQEAVKDDKIRDTLAPIIIDYPGIAKWKKHPTKPDVLIGTWAEDCNEYEITCPVQLRDAIIEMQNTLSLILKKNEV
jgi:hypothetical protein